MAEKASLETLQDLVRAEWHLDRPLAHGRVVLLRIVQRNRADIYARLAAQAAELRAAVAGWGLWQRLIRRRRWGRLRAELAEVSERMARYDPQAEPRPPHAAMREWQHAQPPVNPENAFGRRAALAWRCCCGCIGR